MLGDAKLVECQLCKEPLGGYLTELGVAFLDPVVILGPCEEQVSQHNPPGITCLSRPMNRLR